MSEPRKVYVGNLSFKTAEEDFRAAFGKCGDIEEASIVVDRETGRSRGFGFVTFENEEGAKAAVRDMNETDLDGRTITVSEARPRTEGGGGRGGYGGGRGRGNYSGGRGGRYGGGGGGRYGGGGGRYGGDQSYDGDY